MSAGKDSAAYVAEHKATRAKRRSSQLKPLATPRGGLPQGADDAAGSGQLPTLSGGWRQQRALRRARPGCWFDSSNIRLQLRRNRSAAHLQSQRRVLDVGSAPCPTRSSRSRAPCARYTPLALGKSMVYCTANYLIVQCSKTSRFYPAPRPKVIPSGGWNSPGDRRYCARPCTPCQPPGTGFSCRMPAACCRCPWHRDTVRPRCPPHRGLSLHHATPRPFRRLRGHAAG